MKEPAERGATTVSDRVIAKIAARAATENHDLVGLPRASATVSGQIATVRYERHPHAVVLVETDTIDFQKVRPQFS